MKRIRLTQNKYALVDDADYHRLSKFRWHVRRDSSGTYYAGRQEPTGLKSPRQITVRMHRFIVSAKPGTEVDHRDGNGLNNCRSNLRVTDKIGNQRNRGKQKNNSSGYKGVTPFGSRFRAQMRKNGKHLSFGLYDTAIAAARAYDVAAIRHHGDFARTNFPRTHYENT
jgi:hypothetical protein